MNIDDIIDQERHLASTFDPDLVVAFLNGDDLQGPSPGAACSKA